MEIARKDIDFNEIEVKASGLLNTNMASMFIEFARDKKDISPKDVFLNLKAVKPRIKSLIDEGNMSKLGELMIGFCTFMTSSMPAYNKEQLENVMNFLLLMPRDTAALFISQIDGFDRKSPAFKYMTQIHSKLMTTYPKYKTDFYEPIVKVGEGRA